ncbi:MAG: 30S ribosomal protein S18 [Patescibacteria group bacterium]
MAFESRKRRRRLEQIVPECYFCKAKEEPSFKEVLKIKRFITDRGKIIPKSRSGLCSKHQRSLTTEVKRARLMALIAYTENHAL